MSDPTVKRFPFAKIVIVMAVSFLVGVGLCGLDIALGAHGYGKTGEFSAGPIDGLSLIVMILSAAGLVLSLIVWLLAVIVRSAGSGAQENSPLKRPGDQDKSERDGEP
ncbi:MAG: hypothetical protein ABSG96_14425 [Terracidiphilus sp.]|jgi:hypothetical protein